MPVFRYYPNNPKDTDYKLENRILIHSLIFPAIFIFLFVLVELFEKIFGLNFTKGGLYPLHIKGLPGIILSPFIHSDFNHLLSNAIPFFILLAALIYYYRKISYRIFIQIYILSGICVWLVGREAWHIGASGVVYGLASFHFFSGILRNDIRLLTISVIVIFLYGSMIWGIFPINPDISWESHLWGALSGLILSIYYRKYTIKRKKFEWEEEPDDDDILPEEEKIEINNPTDTHHFTD